MTGRIPLQFVPPSHLEPPVSGERPGQVSRIAHFFKDLPALFDEFLGDGPISEERRRAELADGIGFTGLHKLESTGIYDQPLIADEEPSHKLGSAAATATLLTGAAVIARQVLRNRKK